MGSRNPRRIDEALQTAALEAFNGSYTPTKELLTKFNQELVMQEAKKCILERQASFNRN